VPAPVVAALPADGLPLVAEAFRVDLLFCDPIGVGVKQPVAPMISMGFQERGASLGRSQFIRYSFKRDRTSALWGPLGNSRK
jgi:hypothetical protein